jgi:hypothetical protein
MIAQPILSAYSLMRQRYRKKLLEFSFLEQYVVIRIHLNFLKLFKKVTPLGTFFASFVYGAGILRKIME